MQACRRAYDKYLKTGDSKAAAQSDMKKEYDRVKRGLPLVIYQATFDRNSGASGKLPPDLWRNQRAVRLNGLCMLDIDHLPFPKEVFDRIPPHMFDDDSTTQILLVHVTPSGYGLRVVFKADPKVGNLADNQRWMATRLGVEADEACKDASRGSFVPDKESILFIDKEIFTYDNETYDNLFGEMYRGGRSAASVKRVEAADGGPVAAAGQGGTANDSMAPQTDTVGVPELYRGIAYSDIVMRWLEQNGVPEAGGRHASMLKMAADLRYICDYRQLGAVVRLAPYVKAWETDGDVTKEIDNIVRDVCAKQQWWRMPKRMEQVMASFEHNAPSTAPEGASIVSPSGDDRGSSWHRTFAARLRPLLAPPYDAACRLTTEDNSFGAILAAGTMACTLMTRCWYEHYDGRPHRMNPQAVIIGDPACGKSFVDRLDREFMACMRAADEVGRKAEERYKRERRAREASKGKKDDRLEQPETVIRYLPARTSNAVFYRRARNAKETIDGEPMPLHLYTFDSELDSTVTAQSGGSWIGKHDLELKAFHNELSGVDYANSDSVNDIIPVYWNTVTTGTPLSLNKKINLRNVNDGLCSRVAIFRMVDDGYRMIGRGSALRNHDLELELKEWGYFFDRQHGELKVQQLVEHCFSLCETSAWEAETSSDKVLDYLRKRAVFYAEWLTIPRIVARTRDAEDAALVVTDYDLQFATLMYEAVIYWQDYFFGQMLQDSWNNASQMYQQRNKFSTKVKDMLDTLPKTFTADEVAKQFGIEKNTANMRLSRLERQGYVKRIKKGHYEKV